MKHYILIFLLFSSVVGKSAETNLIYVTDDGMLVGQNSSGAFRLNPRKVETAKKTVECLPASRFPEGNWGNCSCGYQLSLRFETNTFAPGLPVVATILLRNVTNGILNYSAVGVLGKNSPIQILAADAQGRSLTLKSDEMTVISTRDVKVFPGTQQKFREQIDNIYNLPTNGIIDICATLGVACGDVQSAKVRIEIK